MMSAHLKMSLAVGIVETVGKPSVFGEAFPSSEWESAFCEDFHGCGSFHNASWDAFVFAKRGYDAQAESLDSGKALRDCSGYAPGKGIHRPDCPKPQGVRRGAPPMEGAVLRGWEGSSGIQRRSRYPATGPP